MKRMVSLLMTLGLILAVGFFPIQAQEPTGSTVYLSGTGSDSASGSADAPVATLAQAYTLLGEDGGTIVVSGNVTAVPNYGSNGYRFAQIGQSVGKVTLTSVNDAVLTFSGTRIWFPGDTELCGIHLHFAAKNPAALIAECHRLVIDEDVAVTIDEKTTGYPDIYGGGNQSPIGQIAEGASTDVVIAGGTWRRIYAGGSVEQPETWRFSDSVPGNASILVTGGTVEQLCGGSDSKAGVDGDPVVIGGDVSLTVTGGTIGTVVANSMTRGGEIHGKLTVTVSSGEVGSIVVKEFGDGNNAVTGETLLLAKNRFLLVAEGFDRTETLPPEEGDPEEPEEATVHPKRDTVYLSGTGDDSAPGSEEEPVRTLHAAYRLLEQSGGTVIVSADATVEGNYRDLCLDAELLNVIGPVTLTSSGESVLTVAGGGIWFPGDTTLDQLHLHFTGSTELPPSLVANCHRLVIGQNVTVTIAGNVPDYPIIYGGGNSSYDWILPGSDADVTVAGGTWSAVYGGGALNSAGWGICDDVPGDVSLTVTGGTVRRLYGGANGGVGGTEPIGVYGDISINVTGGVIEELYGNGATNNTFVHGNILASVTGGTVSLITIVHSGYSDYVDGDITLLCAEPYRGIVRDFCHLEPPEPVTTTESYHYWTRTIEPTTGEPEGPTSERVTGPADGPTEEITDGRTPDETEPPVWEKPKKGCHSAASGVFAAILLPFLPLFWRKREENN